LFRFVILGLFVVLSLVPCGFLGCSVYFGVFRFSCFAVTFGGLSCVLGLGLMVVLCLLCVGWLGGDGCLFVRLDIWCPAAGCLSVKWWCVLWFCCWVVVAVVWWCGCGVGFGGCGVCTRCGWLFVGICFVLVYGLVWVGVWVGLGRGCCYC